MFLRPSTGPNRRFQPQSLGRVRDPVRIAEGPTAIDAATQRRHFGFRLRLVDKLQPIGGASKGHVERMGNAGSSRSTRRKLDQRHDSARSTKSSVADCANCTEVSRTRINQNAGPAMRIRTVLGADYLALLQFFLNHRRFLRSEYPSAIHGTKGGKRRVRPHESPGFVSD